MITEGLAKLEIPENSNVSRKSEVFYNTRMKICRDVAIHVIKNLKPKTICDAFGGSGVRSVRFVLEADAKDITICDIKDEAIELIKNNLKLNNVKVRILQENSFNLLQNEKFDYIDIDPFGSPAGFFPVGIEALNPKGIVAATATDVSCLSGRFIGACKRKYQAKPLKCAFGKEIGLRILIGKGVRDGLEIGKKLKPIFSHSSNHFLRTYLQLTNEEPNLGYLLYCHKCLKWETVKELKEKECCSQRMDFTGPLWLGKLWDDDLVKDFDLIKYIEGESEIKTVGFYNLHAFASKYKKPNPKIDEVIEKIKPFKASRTHISPYGVRSDIPFNKFVELFF